jgi:Raf kinase inhibitor-like YbhB/YbcL family protein
MRLTSTAYSEGQRIPMRFTCDGEDISPDFSWQDAPKETKAFALILHDPDAPKKDGFYHWVIYNIPPNVTTLREDFPKEPHVDGKGEQGRNTQGQIGYVGPCPPSGNHRYFARLYALRKPVNVPPGADAREVQSAMEHDIIEQTELMGTYEKTRASKAS